MSFVKRRGKHFWTLNRWLPDPLFSAGSSSHKAGPGDMFNREFRVLICLLPPLGGRFVGFVPPDRCPHPDHLKARHAFIQTWLIPDTIILAGHGSTFPFVRITYNWARTEFDFCVSMNMISLLFASCFIVSAIADNCRQHHDMQMPLGYVKYPYQAQYPGDGEGIAHFTSIFLLMCVLVTADAVFSGITTFAKLPWVQCLTKEKDELFDIAFIGAPFVSSKLVNVSARLTRSSGYGYIISAWSKVRSCRDPCWLPSPDPLWWLQCTPRSQPLPFRSEVS